MENLKEIFEINQNMEGYSLSKVVANEKVETARIYCGASDSYFEDM